QALQSWIAGGPSPPTLVPTATPSRTPTPTATPSPSPGTATPTASLNGSVSLQGRGNPGDPRWVIPLSVKLFQPGSNTLLVSANPTTNNNGQFTITRILPGTYDVEVKHAQSLSQRANGLVLAAGPATSR